MLFRCLLALPIACAALVAGESDGAIAGLMRRADPRVRHVKVLTRTQVDPTLNLVVALGTKQSVWPPNSAGGEWDKTSSLGLYLQHRQQPGMIYQIAVTQGRNDGECYARVERVTASQVVISCTPEKGSHGSNWKFLFDARAKTLVKQLEYDRVPLNRVSVSGRKAVFAGTDSGRDLTVEYDPESDTAFRVRKGLEVPATSTQERRVVRFGPGNQFDLVTSETGATVEEGSGPTRKTLELPRSTFDLFALARPGRVKDGYVREHTHIAEAIGPWQLAEGTLWFAKSFCDGEGMTGVGGFGYVDTAVRRFRMYAPPELVNWSASAILVEPDAVWIGLVNNGEWGGTGGGLLRFDRASEKTELIQLRDIVGGIARVGDRLVMATEFGLAILEGSSVRRYFIDRTSAGAPVVVEAVIETYNNSRR